MKKIGIGYSSAKIILIGEHSVVYGEPSIALPFSAINIKALVTSSTTKTTIDCAFYNGLLDDMPELLDSLKKAILLSLEKIKQTHTPLAINIVSDIPAERGMGSSAAVAVASVRAIFDYFNVNLPYSLLLQIVNESEKIAHGNPSGIDALMTSSDTPFFFIRGQSPEPISLNLNAVLIVADTGITGRTKQVVASIAEKYEDEQQNGPCHSAIYQLGQLAYSSKHFIESNQSVELGRTFNEAQHLLSLLGVSSPELDTLIAVARENGALGSKLTGGGAGGCMIALANNKKDAEHITTALKNNGAKQTWLYEMSDINETISQS
ncbi:mevalonate kinase [Vagococcus sp. PNs007]|uniref:Mevalonate kinase n=1 Tax=Vagococcus proximus TaxID=2991417 RepID=A0ABT5WYS3_9ENTE|nr:mevalonate kinase [Vagococcus proximus]MDF0478869.1 mevalonate kinase [Vagococcus proximus]